MAGSKVQGLVYVSGYVVGRLFTSIFELAVDTTLQCFLCCEVHGHGVGAETLNVKS